MQILHTFFSLLTLCLKNGPTSKFLNYHEKYLQVWPGELRDEITLLKCTVAH